MERIEYRYIQGEKGLKAAIQLEGNRKWWNNTRGCFQEKLEGCCMMPLLELSMDNVYNNLNDEFEFMHLYKDVVEDGLYVTAFKELNLAPGVLYSIHIFKDGHELSTTFRQKESSKKYLEMINEVQIRLGFPVSKRLGEPNAKKIGRLMNDVISELLPCGSTTLNTLTTYRFILPKHHQFCIISPVLSDNINGIGRVYINGEEIKQVNGSAIMQDAKFDIHKRHLHHFHHHHEELEEHLPPLDEEVEQPEQEEKEPVPHLRKHHQHEHRKYFLRGTPSEFSVSSKSNHDIGLTFNSVSDKDEVVVVEVYERPRGLKFASDRTVYDTDLVIKGTEYLAKDDAGMGGDIAGRELFLRYLNTDSNLNEEANWSKVSA